MCGIFGIISTQANSTNYTATRALLERLYRLSESRGKESAGLHAYLPHQQRSWTAKSARPARKFIGSHTYKAIHNELAAQLGTAPTPMTLLAHSRLVTNGSAAMAQNNQPVRSGDVTVVHNGIIVNIDALWAVHPNLTRTAEVDTEIVSALLAQDLENGASPPQALARVYHEIKGAASIATVHDRGDFAMLATNTGDLYYALDTAQQIFVFASERYILLQALQSANIGAAIAWLSPGSALHVSLQDMTLTRFEIQAAPAIAATYQAGCAHQDRSDTERRAIVPVSQPADESLLRYNAANLAALKRCSRCILPETFPYIHFDAQGVCNYCHGYTPKYATLDAAKAKADFIASLAQYRRVGEAPDVIVPFSGGRDSSYGLHLIQKEFGLKPITFTYDWGMVTDLARRNIARICGELGIQNILVSADIAQKRTNIRKNVAAWLRKPDLGLVPLFMAGDKHFFLVNSQLQKQLGIDLNIWCANPLENTDFKSGLCGIEPDFAKHRLDYLSLRRKLQLMAYYGKGFLGNPRYINRSLLDTATAFFSYYFEPRVAFYGLFNHIRWDEKEVDATLLSTYDWEISPDSPSTWRIGDGTAPFYNYIYVTANGYSEFDTFRSNQIREGMISREEALQAVLTENHPRAMSLRWYLDTIGLDFNTTIRRINTLDTRGLHSKD